MILVAKLAIHWMTLKKILFHLLFGLQGQDHTTGLHISIARSIFYEPFAWLLLPFLVQWLPQRVDSSLYVYATCVNFSPCGINVSQTFLVTSKNKYCTILYR